MREMIHGMLTLSRAGRVIGDFTAVDLSELVRVVAADVRELVRSRNGELEIRGELPVVWGDRSLLSQLLVNLISNGIKFNKNLRPRVEVGPLPLDRLGSSDGETPISPDERSGFYVKDNGIGVEPRFHEAIFQLFRRLHTQEEFEGTGAGLAICSKIVQAHSGRIWVESAPGQGSMFCVRLRRPTLQAQGVNSRDGSLETPSTETAAAQMSTDEFNSL
jgi:signal transduction histidine kinase